MVLNKIFTDPNILRFNVAAWQHPDSQHVILLGRELEKKGKNKEPDIGRLFIVELDSNNQIIHERIIWRPVFDNLFLEDPRALIVEDNQAVIGLTAVLRNKKGFQPFPAVVKVNINSWKSDLPPVMVIQNFGPGKNLTPIGRRLYLFRPEGEEYNHKMIIFSIKDNLPYKEQELEFPTDLDWAKWRFGTTMPPIWLSPTEALLIVHGITVKNNKYVYSLGRAKLEKDDNKYRVTVAPNPIFTPQDIKSKNKTLKTKELHPRLRKVVYACGGIINPQDPDFLDLYVNIGDTNTYQLQISFDQLKSGLF